MPVPWRSLSVALTLPLAVACGAPGWTRAEGRRFIVLSDASPERARSALLTLEAMAQAWPKVARPLPQDASKVRVVVFRSEGDYAPYRDSSFESGVFFSGPDHDTIVTAALPGRRERILRHEFVHYAQRISGLDLPRWLKEGAAEYYSLLELEGKRARIGLPDKAQWEILKQGLWPGVGEFFLRPPDAERPDGNPARFYAHAWAVAWVLLEDGYGALERYDEHARRGLSPEAAFEAAFGMPWVKALSEAQARFASGTMTARQLDWAPSPLEAPRRVGPVGADEAVLALADLAMAAGRWEHAGRLLAPLRKRPPNAAILAGLAQLSLKRGRMDEARAQFQQAVEMGAEDADAWFELAMLERDRGAPRPRVLELLDGACLRNPGHADARFLRGKQRGGLAALDDLRAAAQLRPERPDFWRELAAAESAAGRREPAREAAMRALKAARTLEDAEQARGLLRIVEAPPAEPAPPKPAVSTPAAWQGPKGDSRFEGLLEHIDCSGAMLMFRVRSETRIVIVYSVDPGRIKARGDDRTPREFACGPQPPRPVLVEYNARPDRPPGTDGDLVAIKFR